MPSEHPSVSAILDTNVLMDLYSCHDLIRIYDKAGITVHSREAAYRRARARGALLLAVFLHRSKAVTYGPYAEPLRLMERNVDPTSGDTFAYHFTNHFTNFVRETLLGDWQHASSEGNDAGVKGDAADERILGFAKEHAAPLVTNEGFSPHGIALHGLRARAQAEGVAVFTPTEYWTGKLDPAEASEWFLKHYRDNVSLFIADHPNPPAAEKSLMWMYGAYQHVLLGRTEGLKLPASVARLAGALRGQPEGCSPRSP